jgi:hypothetical protein
MRKAVFGNLATVCPRPDLSILIPDQSREVLN